MTRPALAALLALLLAAPPALSGDETRKPAPKAEARKAPPSPKSRKEALRLLERVLLSVDFDGTPLADAVSYVSTVTGVNVVIGPALLKEGGLDALKVTLRLKKVSARQVLELMADGKDLGIGFQSGVLLVTTRKEARGKPLLRLHPLGDLLLPLRDFPAPDLVLRPAGAEKKEEPEVERKSTWGDADEILDFVKKTVGEGTWEDPDVSASVMGSFLVIRQYEEVHAEVGALLVLLRASR